ncbi:restriction endonuclease [Mariprofundus ferrooxydans]|uniref:restriction endonuclease n=1 Tax=Mariprofundus ferrooxydans TaxID=314344 RepID=UPI00142F63F0|nr:restriction endonuclease [Mariprofundus ferrooxydans]
MPTRSSYDELHDSLWSADIRKSGTRYERLTAFVFKALRESDTVIHDIKLMGGSDVKHQLDVTIEKDSKKTNILIECKDFDVSGSKVGLGIVRDFWGVVDDIHPDEAMIITCNGFTADAMKYAKSKNIKLAVLREFQESDWQGRIKTIGITMHVLAISEPKVQMYFDDQEMVDKFSNDLSEAGIGGNGIWKGAPVFLNFKDKRIQFNEHIEQITNAHPRENPGPVKLKIDLSEAYIEVESRGPVNLPRILVEFEVLHGEEYFEVTSDKVAKLILSDMDASDIVICEEDLVKLAINEETGEIVV